MNSLFISESLDHFKTVLQEVFNILCGNNESAIASDNPSLVEAANQEIKQLIIDCNFDMNEVAAVIKTKSWDQDKVKYFLTILQERRINLLYALLTHGTSTHGESLSNFNWVLKLVLGSSEMKSLKYPLVQLMFNTRTSNSKVNQKMYELNKEAVNKFISVLESVE